jgi:hypothetical protein
VLGVRDFVELTLRRNRGWPWPEDSWGLTPAFGADGWCRSCGTPRHGQTGDLVVQRRGHTSVGAWVPNWRFDMICLDQELADRTASQFRVELRDVRLPSGARAEARQIVAPTVGEAWFDQEQLRETVMAHHDGRAGARCSKCGVWRWLPMGFTPAPPLRDQVLPPLLDVPELADVDVAASPEWFGDGSQSFRQVLVRRALAELIIVASPRDFRISEVS